MISEKMRGYVENSSAIRAMFEEGKKMADQFGAENVYDFSLGNPNVPAPAEVKNAIEEILKNEDARMVHGYMNNAGYEDVREAVAASLNQRFGTAFHKENILMTVGAAGGMNVLMKTLLNPGDEVLTFAPFFPEYNPYINMTGATLKVVPANTIDFQINFDKLEEMLNENTAAVLINTPNNPSGVVYSAATLQKLADLLYAKQKEYGHDIFLISDEPYREIVFAGVEAPYVSKFYDNTLSCYSYSKSLSLPGERIGYVAVNPRCRDAELISAICAQISRGIGHNCPSSIIQLAVSEVLDMTSDMSVYETNMNLLYNELTSLGFECVKPGGTFYIFPKALEEDAVAFSQKALKYDLILVPSDSFGVPGYFRMAYCIDTEKVERSLTALRRFVKENY